MSRAKSSLEDQRSALEAQLTEARISPAAGDLVRQADAALAAHRTDMAALETQIAEIDAALGVRENDRRTAAATARAERWQAQRKALLVEEETRLTAVADAEAACRAMVDAVKRILASNIRLQAIARDLSTTKKIPSALNQMELESRIACRIASLVKTIKPYPGRFGQLECPGTGLYPPDQSWRDSEEKMAAGRVLQSLIEQGRAE